MFGLDSCLWFKKVRDFYSRDPAFSPLDYLSAQVVIRDRVHVADLIGVWNVPSGPHV